MAFIFSHRKKLTLFTATTLICAIAAFFVTNFLTNPQASALAPRNQRADEIIVHKSQRIMALLRDGKEIKRYQIKLGFSPEGQKEMEGDGKTPLGTYHINRRNSRSRYHLSLGLDYPLPQQKAAAKAKGINPGGDIFIHGQPNAMRGLPSLPHDWTDGCIAVTNKEIEEIWSLVPIGTKITINQ